VSPRLAYSKATDLLPVTGPVSSKKKGDHVRVAFLILLILNAVSIPLWP